MARGNRGWIAPRPDDRKPQDLTPPTPKRQCIDGRALELRFGSRGTKHELTFYEAVQIAEREFNEGRL